MRVAHSLEELDTMPSNGDVSFLEVSSSALRTPLSCGFAVVPVPAEPPFDAPVTSASRCPAEAVLVRLTANTRNDAATITQMTIEASLSTRANTDTTID